MFAKPKPSFVSNLRNNNFTRALEVVDDGANAAQFQVNKNELANLAF